MIKKVLSVAGMSVVAVAAHADGYYQEFNKTVAHLGVQGTSAYFQFNEGFSQPCNEIYIGPEGSRLYVQVLSAKDVLIKSHAGTPHASISA